MGKKLLLADDSVTIQKVVGISFANEDVELITVDNGDDAVTRARAERPDVVLADVVMPGMNGYEVCEALKSDPELAHVPVLLLTGTFEAFDDERAAACGAAGHIAKPFEAQALVDRVRELLSAAPAASVASVDDDGSGIAIGRLGVDPSGSPVAATPAAASAADSFDFFDDALGATPAPAVAATTLDLDPEENVFAFADAEPPAAPATPVPDFGRVETAAAAPSAPPAAPLADPAAEPMSDLLAAPDDILAAQLTDSLDDPLAGTQLMSEELISDELPPSIAGPDDIAMGLDTGADPSDESIQALVSAEADSADLFAIAGDEADPLLGDQLGNETILDPQGASGYDVSGTDLLITDDDTNPDAAEDSSWGVVEGTMPPVGGAAPDPSEPRPLAGMPPATLEAPSGETLDAAAVATLMDESSLEEVAFAEPAPDFAIGENAATVVEAAAAHDDNLADFSELSGPLEDDDRRVSTSHDPAALAGIAMAEIEPQLREQLHDTLEKIAWENLGAVTEQIINQAVERIERAAWEVIPEMAETLIREEIRKMKGE